MALRFVIAALCVVFASAASEECSVDAKKLTSLVANITIHVNDAATADRDAHNAFLSTAIPSLSSLQTKVDNTQLQLDSHRQSLTRLTVQLTQTKAIISNIEYEKTVIQKENENTQLECTRSEEQYQHKKRQYEQILAFIETLQNMFTEMAARGASQESTMTLLQALPALRLPLHSHSKRSAKKLLEVQTLLQQSSQSSGDQLSVEKLHEIMDTPGELQHDIIEEADDAARRNQKLNDECTAQMNALRDRLSRLQTQLKDAEDKVQRLTAQINDETSTVDVLSSDLNILSHSLKSKQQVLENMKQAHQMRSQIRAAQLSQLNSLLSSPACCMCPQAEAK